MLYYENKYLLNKKIIFTFVKIIILKQYQQHSDSELLEAFRLSSDKAIVGELFLRYNHLVFGVCVKYFKNIADAEDTLMEIFEKLHLDINKQQIEQWKGWLYMVAKNHCLMKLRKVGLDVQFTDIFPDNKNNDKDLDDAKVKEAILLNLEHHLGLLKSEQKKCLTLFYIEEKSYKQIVTETNFSLNEIKSHIQNGKANLKKNLLTQN